MKRRYIGIEQMDYIENITVQRLQKVIGKQVKVLKQAVIQQELSLVAEEDGNYHKLEFDKSGVSQSVNCKGGGSFVYAELKRYNQQYMDEIENAKDSKALFKLYEQMKDETFFRIEVDHSKWNNGEFEKLELKEQKELLCECLDKNHLYVNLSEMKDSYYKMSKDDIALNEKFYSIS